MASCTVGPHVQEKVVEQLKELFGNVLNLDVIKTVAVSCEYDVYKSSNKLLEITSCGQSKTVIELDSLNNSGKTKNSSNTPSLHLSKFKSETLLSPRKSKKAMDTDRTIKHIKKGYRVLVIMRGLPGSGKTTLAKEILEQTIGCNNEYAKIHILSTDDYFYRNAQGVYRYDSTKIEEAHNWNQRRAFEALSRSFSPVIIDNTNTQMWEMQPYSSMACDYGYIIEILEPDTHWCFNDRELTKRNKHGVPRNRIQDMIARYDKNITPHKLLSAYNLAYKFQKPPQMRLHPPPRLNTSQSVTGLNTNHNKSENINANNIFVLNYPVKETTKPIETIDLMEFNDEENSQSSRTSSSISNSTDGRATKENLVDEILMIDSDSNSSNILQPQQNSMDVIVVDSDEENNPMTTIKIEPSANTKPEKSIFSNIESAWGVNENYLKSWDIVTPIEDSGNLISFTNNSRRERKVDMTDAGCNTNERDFDILKNPTNITEDVTVMITLNRDINRYTQVKEVGIPKKSVVDKSCMTDDVYEDFEHHMEELTSLFPSVPMSHLRYWYNKCKGDLEWTIEFLLEADRADILIDEETIALECPQQHNDKEISNIKLNENVSNQVEASPSTSKSSKKKSPKHNNNDLKRLIESKIDINPKNYSKHVLRIKNFKFSNNVTNEQEPCTSKQSVKEEDDNSNSSEENSRIDDAIVVDSDIEFEEAECNATSKCIEKPEEETVELNLGDYFVSQLEQHFGDPNIRYPEGFQPVVQVPVAIARQLYTFYIESVFQQMENQQQVMETLTKEDEEFARKLQAKEQEEASPVPPISFKEIMAEQEQLSQMQKQADKWKLENPDNLAARLTKQKLFHSFPTIEQDTLVEILYAHDNKYADTVESLLASTTSDNVRGSIDVIKEPPIKDEVLDEMREAHKENTVEDYMEAHQATFYREEADKFLQKRADLYAKAQEYHQRGMNEVAQFYSTLATQQTRNYERANSLAAMAFLDEHSKRLEDFNTLDLHFLYVKEAIPALDVFLDRNIHLLRHSQQQYEHLHIITGRGKNSENGKPKLKPAVMNHLQKRNIQYVVLNPGLLKVKITKSSLVTSEFK